MARHLMAVCVVCLLCAEHLPCKHVDDNVMSAKKVLENDDSHLVNRNYMDISHLTDKSSYHTVLEETLLNKRRGRTKNDDEDGLSDIEPALLEKPNNRDKRHAVHTSDKDDEPDVRRITQMYVRKTFERFGDEDKMTVIGFEKLWNALTGTDFSKASKSEDFNDTVSVAYAPNALLSVMVTFLIFVIFAVYFEYRLGNKNIFRTSSRH